MKKIKKLLFVGLFPVLALTMGSCTDYQDEIDQLDVRVTNLENLVSSVNTDLIALQKLADVLKDADVITGWKYDNEKGGYYIEFLNHDPIFIKDGKDGKVPTISIRQNPNDGEWYWTINGEYILVDGKPIRANGKNGEDAVQPIVKIAPSTEDPNILVWYVSYDNGANWNSTEQPCQGANGNTYFESFEYSWDPKTNTGWILIKTADGQTFKIPVYKSTN